MKYLATLTITLLLTTLSVNAQQTINKEFEVAAGKEEQIGVFGRLRPDCSTGPVEIRILKNPSHGTLQPRRAQLVAGSIPECPDTPVPVAVFQYRAASDYSGEDTVVIEIETDDGQSERHHIRILVTPN